MPLRPLNQATSRGRILGTPKTGIKAELIPSTGSGGRAAYTYGDLNLPTDNGKEISGFVSVRPSAGNFYVYPDTSFTFTDAPDGTYTFLYQLRVNHVPIGAPTVVTLVVGNGAIIAMVGNAVASGSTAGVFQGRTIAAIVAEAIAAGTLASVRTNVTISATVGNAVANGGAADIVENPITIISGTVGAASAAGLDAYVFNGVAVGVTLSQADIDAIAAAIWAHPYALSVARYIGLRPPED